MNEKAIIKQVSSIKFEGGKDFIIPNHSGYRDDVKVKNFVTVGSAAISKYGGFMISLINKTGAPTVKGSVVAASDSTDLAFKLQDNEYDSIGIVYEDGVADGSAAWVIVSGIAEVLWKDGESATREYVAITADTDGRALNIAVPTVNPAVGEHFKEIGHVIESKALGVNVLVKCVLHFN